MTLQVFATDRIPATTIAQYQSPFLPVEATGVMFLGSSLGFGRFFKGSNTVLGVQAAFEAARGEAGNN